MIDYPVRIADPYIRNKLREIIDAVHLNDQSSIENAAAIAKLGTPLTLAQIQKSITLGGSNPINITGLQGTLANTQPASMIGTHAQRVATPAAIGSFFYETDRTVLYIGILSGNAAIWRYESGVMRDTLANQPPDLGTNDDGFLFNVSDYKHIARWTGPVWVCQDDPPGTFIESVIALGTGYQVCDGSTVPYLVFGATITTTNFITPDEVTAPSGIYHKGIAAYTGTVNAANAPGVSGSTAATTATNNAAVTGVTVTTHNVTQITDVAGANNFAFTAGADAAHTVVDPGHNHTQNAHSHAAGTLAVDATAQPRNLGVLRYFRQ